MKELFGCGCPAFDRPKGLTPLRPSRLRRLHPKTGIDPLPADLHHPHPLVVLPHNHPEPRSHATSLPQHPRQFLYTSLFPKCVYAVATRISRRSDNTVPTLPRPQTPAENATRPPAPSIRGRGAAQTSCAGRCCDVRHDRKHVQKMPQMDANGTRKLSGQSAAGKTGGMRVSGPVRRGGAAGGRPAGVARPRARSGGAVLTEEECSGS